jgi:hypothetical protein
MGGEWIDSILLIFIHFHDRNLCALRWLKQTKPGGTTDEFSKYFDTVLTSDQHEVSRPFWRSAH